MTTNAKMFDREPTTNEQYAFCVEHDKGIVMYRGDWKTSCEWVITTDSLEPHFRHEGYKVGMAIYRDWFED